MSEFLAYIGDIFANLFSNFYNGSITWQMALMWGIGILLIYLAIAKEMEPTLLLPMGFGAILVNLPLSGAVTQYNNLGEMIGEHGAVDRLYDMGIATELFPLLLFIGIGAMIDFGPLLSNPKMMLFGASAQFGIFVTFGLAVLIGFDLPNAASAAIIGAADGPTSIFVANQLNASYTGAIIVAAYSYMALVPVIQPPVIKLLTTEKERKIKMPYHPNTVSKAIRIAFPLFVTAVAGFISSQSVTLVGFLMLGNLFRECGVLDSLSETAQKVLANLITIVLGLAVSTTMQADKFVTVQTFLILGLGLFAFIFDTAGGVLFAKLLNLFSKNKINPMVGAAGISAFPMASRVVHKMGLKEDPTNHLLMHAAAANVSGQIASVVAGGLILKIVTPMIAALMANV